ncbi:MAG: hypothetical protein AAGB22_12960 [Bacteroidota bacterium]
MKNLRDRLRQRLAHIGNGPSKVERRVDERLHAFLQQQAKTYGGEAKEYALYLRVENTAGFVILKREREHLGSFPITDVLGFFLDEDQGSFSAVLITKLGGYFAVLSAQYGHPVGELWVRLSWNKAPIVQHFHQSRYLADVSLRHLIHELR